MTDFQDRLLADYTVDSVPAVSNVDEMPAKKIPLHYFDNTRQLKSTVMCLTLKFDDVLDEDMLHESLIKLIKNDHWRKIGGQLRIGVSISSHLDMFWKTNACPQNLTAPGPSGRPCLQLE